MKPNLIVPAFALALATGLALALTPGLSNQGGAALTPTAEPMVLLAANADNPYGNVDHRNDAGNDTGDSQTDRLNAGQLDRNYRGPWYYKNGQPAPPPGAAATSPPPGAFYAPQPPPPGPYAPPR